MNPLLWIIGLIPGGWKALVVTGAASILAVGLVYGIHNVLDSKAQAEKARADLVIARQTQVDTVAAFDRYRQFTAQAHAAERRAAESRVATRRKLKPLREITRAATPADDGPLPRISQLFFAGLRQLQSPIITGPGGADPGSPAGAPDLRSGPTGPDGRPGGNLRVPTQ